MECYNVTMNKWILGLILSLFISSFAFAQNNEIANTKEEVFSAKVISILEQNDLEQEDGSIFTQQKLKLTALSGTWKGKEITYDGTGYSDTSASEYKIGDKVLVQYSQSADGQDNFYISGIIRTAPMLWLAILFALVVIFVGKWKGFRALVVLALTFLIILEFILPQILAGKDPLTISIIGCFVILAMAIYFTEGFKRTSTVAISAVTLTLLITGLLSVLFSSLTRLTGLTSEETMFLIGLTDTAINLKGLLLAGMLIGALGVLDDVVVSQTAIVMELKKTTSYLSVSEIYQKAMKIGISHLGSMINTLFLAYAGATLPLLLLFVVHQPPFLTFGQVINYELVTVEIIRTLTGSIGIALAVPITTLLAIKFGK